MKSMVTPMDYEHWLDSLTPEEKDNIHKILMESEPTPRVQSLLVSVVAGLSLTGVVTLLYLLKMLFVPKRKK